MHPLLAARINNQFTDTNAHQPLRVHGSANTDAQLSGTPSSALHVTQTEMESCSWGKIISP